MSIKVELLRKYIREIIKQELKLQEASATGAIDGGEGPPKTPYAFQSKRKKDKEKEHKIAKQSGYSIAESINEITLGQMLAKQGKKIKMVKKPGGGFKMTFVPIAEPKPEEPEPENESITEGRYHDYRNDESLTAKQKIGYSMREVRDKLNELDKLVKMNVRLKNEVGVNSTDYWKNTHNAMKKISERLVKLANKVGQLY